MSCRQSKSSQRRLTGNAEHQSRRSGVDSILHERSIRWQYGNDKDHLEHWNEKHSALCDMLPPRIKKHVQPANRNVTQPMGDPSHTEKEWQSACVDSIVHERVHRSHRYQLSSDVRRDKANDTVRLGMFTNMTLARSTRRCHLWKNANGRKTAFEHKRIKKDARNVPRLASRMELAPSLGLQEGKMAKDEIGHSSHPTRKRVTRPMCDLVVGGIPMYVMIHVVHFVHIMRDKRIKNTLS